MALVISIVSYPFLPAKVGGQKGIAFFNKYFSKYCHLICITTRKNDPAFAEGYELRPILSNSRFRYLNPLYYFTIRKVIRQTGASHLMLEHPYYGWLGVLLKWTTSVRLVVHSHNMEGIRWKTLGRWWWPILWQYEKWTHRRADYNFFIHDEDKSYATLHFGLDPARCITMTYGIESRQIPSREDRLACRSLLESRYGIESSEKILFFNGAFDHAPNRDALQKLLTIVNPLLVQKEGFRYRILICGRDIPQDITAREFPHVHLAGFVQDIETYFMGADLFLNPITEGGGIKTKLVEAIGYNLNAVSTQHGALGVDPAICNGKLFLCRDGEWNAFADRVIEASQWIKDTPETYFAHFYWGYSTQRAARFIEGSPSQPISG